MIPTNPSLAMPIDPMIKADAHRNSARTLRFCNQETSSINPRPHKPTRQRQRMWEYQATWNCLPRRYRHLKSELRRSQESINGRLPANVKGELGRRTSRGCQSCSGRAGSRSTKTGAVPYLGFHSRASFWASASCAGVICRATISLFLTASLNPLAAAKLNHMCAVTSSCGTPSPLSYMAPRLF